MERDQADLRHQNQTEALEIERQHLSDIVSAIDKLRDELKLLTVVSLSERPPSTTLSDLQTRATRIAAVEQRLQHAEESSRRQRSFVLQAERSLAACRKNLLTAIQKVRAFEKLRDQQHKDWMTREASAEANESDEIARQLHGRQPKP